MSALRVGVLINPTAGHGRGASRGRDVLAALRARGHDVVDLTAGSADGALRSARQAVVDGIDALVAVGGDGMVHLGANVVAGTDLPLGIVAAGSGNDVARAAGLPRHDVVASVRGIERGLETGGRAIDAVRIGPPGYLTHEWFLGVLSCGIDAAVNERANTLTWPRGTGRYVRALGTVLRSFEPYGYRITVDGRVWESPGTLVAIANGSSIGGGMRIAPDARMDDGLLDVVIAGPLSRAGVAAIFPKVYPGRHLSHPACSVVRGLSVLVEPSHVGPPPPPAFADGERLGPLPMLAEIAPGAVRLLA